jgi:hypothetical protein
MGGKGSGTNKYTPAVHRELIACLKLGMYKDHAAAAAGISRDTFREWITRGERGESAYVQLVADMQIAQGAGVRMLIAAIADAASGERKRKGKYRGDWKAAAWLLERMHPLIYNLARREVEDVRPPAEDKPRSPWLRPELNAEFDARMAIAPSVSTRPQ